MNKYTENEKSIITARYNNGEAVAALVRDTQIPRSTIYTWIKDAALGESSKKTVSPKNIRVLENKVTRLQGTRHRLRRNWISSINKPFWS